MFSVTFAVYRAQEALQNGELGDSLRCIGHNGVKMRASVMRHSVGAGEEVGL